MIYQQSNIPDLAPDEVGYLVEGVMYASVRLSRSAGAAPHVFGVTAIAFAVNADGTPLITAAGKTLEVPFTHSCVKVDLLLDGVVSLDKVDDIKRIATEGALTGILTAIASEAAFDNIGI